MLNKLFALFLCCAALVGCSTTTTGGLVGADRSQAMLVPSEQINASAKQAYNDVIAQAQQKKVLNVNQAQTNRVRAIAKRIIPTVGAFRADAVDWAWEVNVISENTLNAWCMPGGKIVFYTGIIDQLKLTDDEIAAIMGHEIAHALREHSRERASEELLTKTGIDLGVALLGGNANTAKNAGIGAQLLIGLPNSRKHETEADRIGVELSARAGYNPRAAIQLWQKMSSVSSNSQPQFLSTHPSNSSRISDLEVYSAKVMPLYQPTK